MRLVDRRFHGVAQYGFEPFIGIALLRGVGTSKIVGRIHLTQVKLGSRFFAASITVLEDARIDFLFGLDLLRRHQCVVDFKKNVLCVDEEEVPFLSEHETKAELLHQASSDDGLLPPGGGLRRTEDSKARKDIEEEFIRRVMSIGATRSEAIAALEKTGWNPDLAASLLFQEREFVGQ